MRDSIKEISTLKNLFLHDLKLRGIPKDGTTSLVIFSEECRKKLIDFGFKLTKTNKVGYLYSIDYPKKPKSIIKQFFEMEFQDEVLSSNFYEE